MPNGITIAEIGGICALLFGNGLLWRFMNKKIDDKQDKPLCDERSGHIIKALDEIKVTQKEILKEVHNRNGTH